MKLTILITKTLPVHTGLQVSLYSEQDAMLVLKDILAHEYMDNRKKDYV